MCLDHILTDSLPATRLWQYAARPMDTFGLRAASEAAASVATVLAERVRFIIITPLR